MTRITCKGLQRALLTLPLATALFLAGCSGDSGDTIIRNVSLIVAGFYGPVDGATTLTQRNTGDPVTTLNVTQAGDQLDAVDNNGLIFRGTLGQVTDDTASFTLEGLTTAGQPVTIAGTFSVAVGSSDGTMQGTWIEPSVFSAFAAQGTVPVNNPDSGGGSTNSTEVVITSSPSSMNVGVAANFSASGSGTLTWTDSPDLGSFDSTTGSSVSYTPSSVGSVTITVTDDSSSDSVAITISL